MEFQAARKSRIASSISSHRRGGSASSHESGLTSSTSKTYSSAHTSPSSATSVSSSGQSRLLSSKLFRGYVSDFDRARRCGTIQARTGTDYVFDQADVVVPQDRHVMVEGLPVTFEARLDGGHFRAETVHVAWNVVLLLWLTKTPVSLDPIPLDSVLLEGSLLPQNRVELRDPDFGCPTVIPLSSADLLVDAVDQTALLPGFPVAVDFLRSKPDHYQAITLRIDWRATLHSYTLKMSEDGELALRLAIRKLNAGHSRLRPIRPWLGTIVKAPGDGQAGLIEPETGHGATDRRTVVRNTLPFKANHCWPEKAEWHAGMQVLCWNRSGEQQVSVMLAKPTMNRNRWAWPALNVS